MRLFDNRSGVVTSRREDDRHDKRFHVPGAVSMGYESVTALRRRPHEKRQLASHLARQDGAAVVVASGVTGGNQLAGVYISLPGLKRRVL